MDKIESDQKETDEVKVSMLENVKKAEEHRENPTQRAEDPQNGCKDLEKPVNSKKKQILDYLWANKGLLIVVLISAITIFAVVVAMLAIHGTHPKHPEHAEHSGVHIDLENP